MYYVYLLQSKSHPAQNYVGLTRDLRTRLAQHNNAASPHTKKFYPWRLVAYFAFKSEATAAAFGRYLKSGSGRPFARRHFRDREDEGKQRVRYLTPAVDCHRRRFRRQPARTPRAATRTKSAAPHNQVDASGTADITAVSASGAARPVGLIWALMPKLAPVIVR
jgi:putative endonuclease